jgi:hypothetical protein
VAGVDRKADALTVRRIVLVDGAATVTLRADPTHIEITCAWRRRLQDVFDPSGAHMASSWLSETNCEQGMRLCLSLTIFRPPRCPSRGYPAKRSEHGAAGGVA